MMEIKRELDVEGIEQLKVRSWKIFNFIGGFKLDYAEKKKRGCIYFKARNILTACQAGSIFSGCIVKRIQQKLQGCPDTSKKFNYICNNDFQNYFLHQVVKIDQYYY
jgi:hypothetical protein